MRRFVVCAAAALGLALLAAAPAYGSHAIVQGEIDVLHGTNGAVDSAFRRVACSTESCQVTLTVSKRAYHRFVRWCESDSVTVTVPSGDDTAGVLCDGPSTWRLIVLASLLDSEFNLGATHQSDVDVTITVTT
jgi:hypothetical protein